MSDKDVPLRYRIALLAITVQILFASWIVSVAASGDGQNGTAQQPAASEKTAEQVQKNIQVLKGTPESQLLPVMNFMSASLGVRCNFCHVNKNGTWDFASDEMGEKKAAREMITMVLGINKNTFRGNTEVSCYTCHRGRTSPVGVPSLPIPEVTPRPAAVEGGPREALPTADQILAKYLEAVGGSAAIDKLKTRAMKGTWLGSNGTSFSYELFQSAPNKVLAVLTTPQGTVERAFNGTAGWEKSPKGVRDMVDEEMFYLKRYPDLFKDIKLKDQFSRLAVAGKDKIDGRDVYVLRGTTIDNRRERLYFDTESGLLVRRLSIMPTSIGNIPEQVDFQDYRDVDGMKLPFTIQVLAIDPFYTSTRKFTEIKLNVPIEDARFNKPVATK
jgi:hypothetical protein